MKTRWYQNDTRLFAGFYESSLYSEDWLYQETEAYGETDFIEGGFKQFEQDVAEHCANNLDEMLPNREVIQSINYVDTSSPKEYNFTTDKLVCDVELDFDKLKEYCFKTQRSKFAEYLKENFTSYDGYVSFIPNEVSRFYYKLEEDENCVDVMIDFYLVTEIDNEDLWSSNAEYARCEAFYKYIEQTNKEQTDEND